MRILVADIGGTAIKWACMDEGSTILSRGKVPTPLEGRVELIEALGQLYDNALEGGSVEGIAISMPGIIDSENGYVAMGGALRYNDDFYLRHALYERCPVHITIYNDAKCAAMAEAGVGALKDVEDGFALIFGTMIGGAYIKCRKLVMGKHFAAGEVSYILNGLDATAGRDEVWGNICGAPGLCSLFADAKGLDAAEVDGIRVFEAVNAGDEEALAVLDKYAHRIAVQIFNLQTILDPERFAIGGGISAQPALLDAIRDNLKRLYAACPYDVPRAEVVTAKFQNDANLVGALQCWLASNREA